MMDSSPQPRCTRWYPSRFFTNTNDNDNDHPRTPYAIIILNQPINNSALAALISSASLLVCADGGGNRLHPSYSSSTSTSTSDDSTNSKSNLISRLPDAVIGDLDSLAAEAEAFYRSKEVPIIKDPDQYKTDFTKCLRYLRQRWDAAHGSESKLDVVALGGLGGRVDQGFSQIHHLYMAERDPTLLNGRIYLLSEQSLSFILDDGVNEIDVGVRDPMSSIFEENVGIIPVMGPTTITIKGFEWDVEDWETEFGGQISTSNHLKAPKVVVEAKAGKRLLFTLELASKFCMDTTP